MKRILAIAAILALPWAAPGCYSSGSGTPDDVAAEDGGGGDGDVAPDAVPDTTPDGTPDATPDGTPDAVPDATPDEQDTPADTPTDGCTGPAGDALEGGSYAIQTLDVLRPSLLGSLSSELDTRITNDDIYVILDAENLTRAATSFGLSVGQAQERTYPTAISRFCTDAICGWSPNIVTSYSATVDSCNHFGTLASSDLTFSLYPPPHGTTATLVIAKATVSGTFDASRQNIVNGLVTGGITEATAAGIYPMPSVTLASLLSGVALDFDANGDTIMDGWQVEIQFTATAVPFERP